MKRKSFVANQESKIAITITGALRRALLVALAAPATVIAAQACSSSSDGNVSAPDGSIDASNVGDGSTDDGQAIDFDGGPCAPKTIYVDAGPVPDGSVECGIFRQFSCGLPEAIAPEGGTEPGMLTLYDDCFFSTNNCSAVCPGEAFFNCSIHGSACDAGVLLQNTSDPIIVDCVPCPNGVGRKPRGLQSPRAIAKNGGRTNDNALGKYFANAAHLEAASVHAFRILRSELSSYKAPRNLLDAAKRAEADEVKHARMTTRIARAHGGKPPKVRVRRGGHRSLEAIATENAVEGCVRETFGALIAMWQAERATDRHVAAAMKEIAVDETRHAALAWSVAAWASHQLDARSRKRVTAAKNKAIRDLEKEIAIEAHPDLRTRAGLPNASEQRRLLSALSSEVFAGADFET